MPVTNYDSNGVSLKGPVREDNQDAILLPSETLPDVPLYAVADGMGGYANGGAASALALKALQDCFSESPFSPPVSTLKRGLYTANLDVYKAAQELNGGRMGTTLTAATVSGNILHILHVGDSRAYLIRDGRASVLTNDHTVVGDMVRSRIIPPEKLRTHAQRSVLTRAVGLSLFVQPDIEQVRLKIGDRIILCSDGVWSFVEDDEFAEISRSSQTLPELNQALLDLALERQTDDNCSIVSFQVHGFGGSPPASTPRGWRSWLGFSKK